MTEENKINRRIFYNVLFSSSIVLIWVVTLVNVNNAELMILTGTQWRFIVTGILTVLCFVLYHLLKILEEFKNER